MVSSANNIHTQANSYDICKHTYIDKEEYIIKMHNTYAVTIVINKKIYAINQDLHMIVRCEA